MKYEISFAPDYDNERIIIETVKSFSKIKIGKKIRPSRFMGCDVPVILDIECDKETKDMLFIKLVEVTTDQFEIYSKCPTCGRREQ